MNKTKRLALCEESKKETPPFFGWGCKKPFYPFSFPHECSSKRSRDERLFLAEINRRIESELKRRDAQILEHICSRLNDNNHRERVLASYKIVIFIKRIKAYERNKY